MILWLSGKPAPLNYVYRANFALLHFLGVLTQTTGVCGYSARIPPQKGGLKSVFCIFPQKLWSALWVQVMAFVQL
jgi:hypothetical protein